jgi:hypothetical protein
MTSPNDLIRFITFESKTKEGETATQAYKIPDSRRNSAPQECPNGTITLTEVRSHQIRAMPEFTLRDLDCPGHI